VPKKDIIYLQNDGKTVFELPKIYEPTLRPYDLLQITIKTIDKETTEVFNLQGSANSLNSIQAGYLIDTEGFIDFPFVGKFKAASYKKEEFKNVLSLELKKYIKNAYVDIRLLNFRVNVLGEVISPGTILVTSDRISLLEALSKAGDLSIYGNRKNIKLLREENGSLNMHLIDITKTDFISSPYYYLAQNDVVYVEGRRTRADNTAIGSNFTTGISVLSTLLTLVFLLKNL
tara:strand:- start:274 stop:966 length:693 start_codon:yes stop_codon:yes gene_type:complete